MMPAGKRPVTLFALCIAAIIMLVMPLSWTVVGQKVSMVPQALAKHPYLEARSRNGNGYSDSITELRVYKTNDRNFRWYELPELKQKKLVFRTQDKKIIIDILQSADMGPEPGEHGYCDRLLMDYRLHVVTFEEDEEIFGYFLVSPMEAAEAAPPDFGACAYITFSDENTWGWTSYKFLLALKTLGITVQ